MAVEWLAAQSGRHPHATDGPPYFTFWIAAVNSGNTWNRSPTMP